MKNKLIILSLTFFSFIACNKNTFKVDVEMSNANGKTIYLQKITDNQMVNVDSAVISNNNAIFNVKKNDNNDAYHIFIKGWRRALPFFADNNDVTIKGDFNAYNKINISASETQNLLDEFNGYINNLDDENKKLFVQDFVKNNSQSELAPYVIYRYKWLFDLNELKELLATFHEKVSESGYSDKLNEYISLLEKTDIGQPYIDFTIDNVDGQAVELSSLVGNDKLLMIDFWASWCPDCRVENPNIVEIYNDFKDKGFDIISVSLDTDRNAWIKGIADDNLSWKNHVSELKGWNCSAATDYGVAFIPQNFLIDSNGYIVAKNLNGDDLRLFVENYLK